MKYLILLKNYSNSVIYQLNINCYYNLSICIINNYTRNNDDIIVSLKRKKSKLEKKL